MPDPRKHPITNEIPTAAVAGAVSNIILAANPARLGADIVNVSNPSEMISLALGQVAVTIMAHYFPAWRKAILGAKTGINAACAWNNAHN